MSDGDNVKRSIAAAHGAFALFVIVSLLLGCLAWIVPEIGRTRHPYFPQFFIDRSNPQIAAYEYDPTSQYKNADRVIFFRRGPSVRLPFLVHERWEYVADVPESDAYTPEAAQRAIADYLATDTEGSWNSRRMGPPPTLDVRQGATVLVSIERSRFHPGGLLGSVALWVFVVLAIRSAIKWFQRPPKSSPQCTTCGYDLTGVSSEVCPECGTTRAGETRLPASKTSA